MEAFFDQEKTKAFVYLLSDGDDKNKILISDEDLLVIRKNQKQLFALKNLHRLNVKNIKFLFPLITGGIITPFAFLSYFVNLFHPWIHLIALMTGLLLFYIGWNGKSAFIVFLKNGEEMVFYMPSISRNLLAFIEFANEILENIPKSIYHQLMYFDIEKRLVPLLFETKKQSSNLSIFPLFGYTYPQLKLFSKTISAERIIAIDPINAGREIKFSFDTKTDLLRPKLDGPVSKSSIVELPNLLNLRSFFK